MNVNFGGMNGTVSSKTSAEYTEALVIAGNGGLSGKSVISIKNVSGATATMYYKVDAYLSSHPDCLVTAITAETDIVNDTPVVNTSVDKPYAKVVVSVKTHSATCDFQIDYMVY